jgi:hypothetical protein
MMNRHTDYVPIGAGLKYKGIDTNLELSQKGVYNAMQVMIAKGVNPALISAQDFGQGRSCASNDKEDDRTQKPSGGADTGGSRYVNRFSLDVAARDLLQQ